MLTNLTMTRIATKLDELFSGKIDLTDIKNPDEAQTTFYSRAIAALAIMMRCGVDEDTAARCITDGYHDLGVDAVYNDSLQKKLILVQSKWRKDGNGGISQTEAGTFAQGAKRFIDSDFDGSNEKIAAKQADIIAALRNIDCQVEIIFCHTGNELGTEYAKRPITDLLSQVNEKDVVEILIFSEIILKDIYDYLANSQTADNIVLDDVILSNWGTIDEPYKAYYGTISASMVGNWYQLHGNHLFAKNIRYYKGSTEVNQGIKDVLKSEPDKFFYYNNGIKILCQKITRKVAYSTDRSTGLFCLEGVSLVNGAQTTGAIGTLFSEKPDAVERAKVFIQMIDLGNAGEGQATQITKFTNTQNRIDSKDFAALDPEQERIKTELSFSNIQYLYKAGAEVEDRLHQISLDEAIIAQACSMEDLTIVAAAKGNVGALTDNIEKPPYKLLFNGNTNSFQLVNNVRVMRAVDIFLKRKEISATGRKRLVLVHGNRFILHMVLSELSTEVGYRTSFIDAKLIETRTFEICEKLWEKIYVAQEAKYSDAYPAHIYKNSGRIRILKETIIKASENA